MGGALLRFLLAICVLVTPGIGAGLHAREIRPVCHGEASAAQVAANAPIAWRCSGPGSDFRAERAMLRFELDPGADKPVFLVSRASHFEQIVIRVHGADGKIAQARYTMDDGRPVS